MIIGGCVKGGVSGCVEGSGQVVVVMVTEMEMVVVSWVTAGPALAGGLG